VSHFSYCYAECRYAEFCYVECRYAECRYADCGYAECRYAECRGTLECHFCQMLSMLSVANKPFMLRVVMLNVVMLSVVMLNVMVPKLKLRFPERL
jgi:hypothetical protein